MLGHNKQPRPQPPGCVSHSVWLGAVGEMGLRVWLVVACAISSLILVEVYASAVASGRRVTHEYDCTPAQSLNVPNPFVGQTWQVWCSGPPEASVISHISSGNGSTFNGHFRHVSYWR